MNAPKSPDPAAPAAGPSSEPPAPDPSSDPSAATARTPRIPVAVMGATGAVGQRMIQLLDGHPWFEVVVVTASRRSAGKAYRDAVSWTLGGAPPPAVADLPVQPTTPDALADFQCSLVFSALDASVAGSAEQSVAAGGRLVVSNARVHRMDPRVPLLVPEVNADHLALLDEQPGPGGIVTNPNCSTIGLAMVLAPLHRAFGVEAVHVATLQALSGAGLPGVSAVEIIDNVIPFIAGEEEKLETETRKILGQLEGGQLTPVDVPVSAQCSRVPVTDGHLELVSVGLRGSPSPEEVSRVLADFRSPLAAPDGLALPSAPRRPIVVLEEPDAPQPRHHRDLGNGMTVSVGRIRPCPLQTVRMAVLSHNTIRGAAGGAILCAELAVARGRVPGVDPLDEAAG